MGVSFFLRQIAKKSLLRLPCHIQILYGGFYTLPVENRSPMDEGQSKS